MSLDKAKAFIEAAPEEDRTALHLQLAHSVANALQGPDGKVTPEEALSLLVHLPSGGERAAVMKAMSGNLAERNPQALFRWMSEHPGVLDEETIVEAAAEPWVKRDMGSAQAALLGLADSPASRKLALAVGEKLVEAAPQSALEFAERLSATGLADEVKWAYYHWQATNDPKSYLQNLANTPVKERDETLDSALDAWAKTDLNAATAWARANVGQLHAAALARLTTGLAERDLPTARQFMNGIVGDSAIPSDTRVGVVGTVASSWSRTDPAAAAAWAGTLADERMRRSAVSGIAWEWGKSDWPAARQWMESMPEGELRDAAIRASKWPTLLSRPQDFLEILPLIQSDTLRRDMREMLFGFWRQMDATAARAAAEKAGLPEAEIQRMFAKP